MVGQAGSEERLALISPISVDLHQLILSTAKANRFGVFQGMDGMAIPCARLNLSVRSSIHQVNAGLIQRDGIQ